jgi:hypothetical protein
MYIEVLKQTMISMLHHKREIQPSTSKYTGLALSEKHTNAVETGTTTTSCMTSVNDTAVHHIANFEFGLINQFE